MRCNNSRAQTATEYLVILAIIIIALIVVSVLGGSIGMGGGVSNQNLQVQLQSQVVAYLIFMIILDSLFGGIIL